MRVHTRRRPGGRWQEVLFEKLDTMGHYLERKRSDGVCSLASICLYFCHTVQRNVAVSFQEASVFPASHHQPVGNSESAFISVIGAEPGGANGALYKTCICAASF